MPRCQQRFFVPGPLPGLNEILAAKRSILRGGRGADRYAQLKRYWEQQVQRSALAAGLRPVTGPVRVACTWVEPSRRRDPDNVRAAVKFVLDGLVTLGILRGDGWRHVAGLEDRFVVDGRRPGVWVELTEDGEC